MPSIQTIILLQTMSRLLVQYMEVCNKIEDDDLREIVNAAQQNKRTLKNISDNVDRANPFMIVFFLRELLESLTHEQIK